MAKRPEVTKTQAVREYLKSHREAKPLEVAQALTKQGIKITAGHVSNIKNKLKARRLVRKAAKVAAAAPAVAATEPAQAAPEIAASPAGTIALAHVKAVAQTVQAAGGFDKLNELLTVIKEVGGMKKFKDLLDAIAIPKAD